MTDSNGRSGGVIVIRVCTTHAETTQEGVSLVWQETASIGR